MVLLQTNILGMEVVMPDGEILDFGGEVEEEIGYDLRGVLIWFRRDVWNCNESYSSSNQKSTSISNSHGSI